jgi:hypothetical protein
MALGFRELPEGKRFANAFAKDASANKPSIENHHLVSVLPDLFGLDRATIIRMAEQITASKRTVSTEFSREPESTLARVHSNATEVKTSPVRTMVPTPATMKGPPKLPEKEGIHDFVSKVEGKPYTATPSWVSVVTSRETAAAVDLMGTRPVSALRKAQVTTKKGGTKKSSAPAVQKRKKLRAPTKREMGEPNHNSEEYADTGCHTNNRGSGQVGETWLLPSSREGSVGYESEPDNSEDESACQSSCCVKRLKSSRKYSERLTSKRNQEKSSKKAETRFAEEDLPVFKNCRLARLTNGIIRRISNVTSEIPSNTDNTEEDSYEHEIPPGVDVDALQSMTPINAEERNPLPRMVCMNKAMRAEIQALCVEFANIFSREMQPTPARIDPMSLDIDKAKWFSGRHARPPRELSGLKQNAVLDTVRKMETNGLVSQSQALAWSQVLLVKKLSGAWRFCVDYRELNNCLSGLGWRIPNIKQLLQRLGTKRAKYFAVVDLTQGYYQIALAKSSRQFASFITPGGLYEPNRVWMGLKTAGSYFQQQIAHTVLLDCIYKCCEVYIDDVIIFGETEEEFLANLRKVFERFAKYNIFS